MKNIFADRSLQISGPATDIVEVVPSDTANMAEVCVALYVETGGTLRFSTVRDQVRTVTVPDMSILPVGASRVHSTGTTATGIHALVV